MFSSSIYIFKTAEDVIRNPNPAIQPRDDSDVWNAVRQKVVFKLILMWTKQSSDKTAPGAELIGLTEVP